MFSGAGPDYQYAHSEESSRGSSLAAQGVTDRTSQPPSACLAPGWSGTGPVWTAVCLLICFAAGWTFSSWACVWKISLVMAHAEPTGKSERTSRTLGTSMVGTSDGC